MPLRFPLPLPHPYPAQAQTRAESLEESLREMEGPMLKLGDASIAAAFTARSASVTSCVSVILQARPSHLPSHLPPRSPSGHYARLHTMALHSLWRRSPSACVPAVLQGRCTLVTTIQMFQILALNCLVSAYGLSVLHLRGVRMGDTQATILIACSQ